MNSKQVVRRPEARRDLVEHFVYLGEQGGIELGDRFLQAADTAFEELLRMPNLGMLRDFKNPDCREVRSWRIKGFENYLIFYLPFHGGVEILRVLHGAQKIEKHFEE